MVVGQGGTPLGFFDITACVESATRYHLWTIREAGGRGHAHPPPTDSALAIGWLAGCCAQARTWQHTGRAMVRHFG